MLHCSLLLCVLSGECQAAEALSQLLHGESALKAVDMSSNSLGVDGGRLLQEAVAENR